MSIRFINRKSGGSGSIKPNIFVQGTEPEIKKGLWLQKTGATIEHYYGGDSVHTVGEWEVDGTHQTLPRAFYEGSAVSIGTDIYIFGGGSSNVRNTVYKYDTLTKIYTQLTNSPTPLYQQSTVNIDNNIYIFGNGSSSYSRRAYKYNTLTDTYTQLSDINNNFYNGSAVSIGTDIYIFGGGGSTSIARKYNTLTDTYTQLTNIPFTLNSGSAVSIGTDIYIFGGTSAYKYNTLTDTYTQLSDIPYNFYRGSAVNIGTDIYIFGGDGSTFIAYKYNTLTDTYAQLTNIPFSFSLGSAVSINDEIFLLGGSGNTITKVQVYAVPTKTYQENSVIITQGKFYNSTNLVELFSLEDAIHPIKVGIADAWFYGTNGLESDIPTYIGNGTQWIGLKNIPVSGVAINKSKIALLTNTTKTLEATVLPSWAENKQVSWSSSDTSVATVTSDGIVTAISEGTATITVTTADGGFTDTCEVIVPTAQDHYEVEYLESTGTQYIDLNYKISKNTKLVFDIQNIMSSTSSAYRQVTGAKTSYHSTEAIQCAIETMSKKLIIDYGDDEAYKTDISSAKVTVQIAYGDHRFNNELMSTATNNFITTGTANYSLWVFDCNQAGKTENKSAIRLFSYKIYENNELVRDYVPVVKADGTKVLYEKINDEYYANLGTGEFIAGDLVVQE